MNTSINSVSILADIAPGRTGSNVPSSYKLRKKQDGALVLVGWFGWTEGWDKFGGEWREIPTEIENE